MTASRIARYFGGPADGAVVLWGRELDSRRDQYVVSLGRQMEGRARDLHRYVLAYDDAQGMVYESEDIRRSGDTE